MEIREETTQDEAAIAHLTEAAFAGAPHSSGTEAAIVRALRRTGTLYLSLVADRQGLVVGHAAFSPVLVDGTDFGWLGLGPVSVVPERQGQGIGSALIRDGLSRLRISGAGGCVVLGDPAYYLRFGFRHDPGMTFAGAPPEYFMRLPFTGAPPRGDVTYQPAFHET